MTRRRCSCGKEYAWWRTSCDHGVYLATLTPEPRWLRSFERVLRWVIGER